MHCRSCGRRLADGAKFCAGCGARVEAVEIDGIRCPRCRAVNRLGAKFCRQDGTPLAVAPSVRTAPVEDFALATEPQSGATIARVERVPRVEPDTGRTPKGLWLAIGAVLLLGLLGGAYWLVRDNGTVTPVAEMAPEPGSPRVPAPIAEPEVAEPGQSEPVLPTTTIPTGQIISAPAVAVGDRWVSEVVDHQDSKLSYRAERVVTEVGADRIVTSVRTIGKDYVRSVEYSGEWALVATHLRSGATTTYSPALPYLSFPLQPGKSWEAQVVETDAEGKHRVHAVRAQMEEWETVQVPAGLFTALKIVVSDDISKDGVVVQQGQDVSWYAPEARRTVKTEEMSFDPATGEKRRRTISMVEYSLQSAQSSVGAAEGASVAAAVDLSGEAVYKSACVACHGAGIAGAPRFGDKAAWAARIAQGMDMLYAHALNGYQGTSGYMPAKGGRADLSDRSVVNTVDYMIAAVPPPASPSPAESTTRGSTASGSVSLSPLPGHVSLLLTFAADSWVEISDGSGNAVLYDLGRAATQRKIAAAAPLSVTFGNGPAVTMLVNGRPVAMPAPPAGQTVVSFRVEEDGTLR